MEGVDKTPLLHTICFFIPVHVIINFSILSDVLFHVFVFSIVPYLEDHEEYIGHCGMCPLTSNNFILVHFGINPTANYPGIVLVCEISWCRCRHLTALSHITALVTKLIVIEQLLHPALEVHREWPMT